MTLEHKLKVFANRERQKGGKMSVTAALSFVIVGACWGCTTPFIKDGTSVASNERTNDVDDKLSPDGEGVLSRVRHMLGPLRSLASMKAAVPFMLNQSGSLLFYVLLSSQDISMAVPVCNSLTFVFTAATALWLGEENERPLRTILGMALVLTGIAICVASKAM